MKLTDEQKEVAMNEALIKADDEAAFFVQHIREALHFASAVESLVLLPMLEQGVKQENAIKALIAARNDIPN